MDVLAHAAETTQPLIESRRHSLHVAMNTDGLRVEGDLDRLAQAVGTLFTNAAKFTPDGGQIWLDAAEENSEAVVRVRDTDTARRATASRPARLDLTLTWSNPLILSPCKNCWRKPLSRMAARFWLAMLRPRSDHETISYDTSIYGQPQLCLTYIHLNLDRCLIR